jgi:hypothetical protein
MTSQGGLHVTDAPLKPDPTRKGSYYRRIEDIGRAFDALGVAILAPALKFVAAAELEP